MSPWTEDQLSVSRTYTVELGHENNGYPRALPEVNAGLHRLGSVQLRSAARTRTTARATTAARTYVDPSGNGPCAKAKRRTRTNGEEYGLTEIGDLVLVPPQSGSSTALCQRRGHSAMLTGNSAWNNAGIDGHRRPTALYGDDAFYAEEYGLHYNGWAARDDRGLCPSGFAMPVNANFENLLASASENQLVAASGWDNESWNGNNASGFTLIPSGYISKHELEMVRYLVVEFGAQDLPQRELVLGTRR